MITKNKNVKFMFVIKYSLYILAVIYVNKQVSETD